jgi:hypothetical protein
MSNYPPGVTGNEPQIAGYDERDMFRDVGECTHLGRMTVSYWHACGPAQARKHRRVSAAVCTFEGGNVPGFVVNDSMEATFFWDCPICCELHEEDVTGEDDPDPDERSWWDA